MTHNGDWSLSRFHYSEEIWGPGKRIHFTIFRSFIYDREIEFYNGVYKIKRQVEENGKDMTHPLPWSLSLINQVYPLMSISSSS